MPTLTPASIMIERKMTKTTQNDIATIDYAVREHRSLWVDAWRRLISSRTAKAGLFIVSFLILSTVLAHFFWEYNPKIDLDYTLKLKPPTLIPNEEVPSVHIFGTDKLGRDIFRRVVHGGWNTLRVGIIAVTISLVIGGLLGLLAGFFESIADDPPGKNPPVGFSRRAHGFSPCLDCRTTCPGRSVCPFGRRYRFV